MSEGLQDSAPDAYEVVPQSEDGSASRRWYVRMSVATTILVVAGVVVFQLGMKQAEITKIDEQESLKDGLIQKASTSTVNYGDKLWIQNQYGSSHLLDRNSGVNWITSMRSARLKQASSAWKIKCTSKWGCPSCVQYGDEVVIENQHPGLQMLQRHGGPALTTDKGRIKNNAAVWKILGTDFKGQNRERSGCIRLGVEVIIQNQYAGHQLLQRNGGPSLTTDKKRIASGAASWRLLTWGSREIFFPA